MTAAQKHLWIALLLLPCAVAQNPTPLTVRKVSTARQGSDLRIEITVSAPVKPSVDTAANPNRILLDFPNTICNNSTRSVSVHANGVRQVRTAQHSTSPYITRVVLDLDEVRPYVVTAEGNTIILTVAGEEKHASHGAPVAATSGNVLAGVFRRRRDGTAPVIGDSTKDDAPSLPPPPPAVAGPEFQPPSSSSVTALPPPPPAVARPQTTAVTPSNSTPSGTFEQKQVAITPKVAELPMVSPAPAASTVAKAEENPVEIAAASAATQPQPAVSAPATSPAAPPQPTPAAAVSPVAALPPKPEEKSAEVARPTSAAAAVPEVVTPRGEATPTTSSVTESAEASPSPAEPEPTAPATTLIARSDDPSLHTVFRVKYVADGVAYLEGGRTQGLTEGMKLLVQDANHAAKQGESVNAADPKVVAELEVSAVAETSAVTDIHNPKRPVKVGDLAYLSNGDAETLVQQRTLSATRQYPAVIAFTEGDTLDEETRMEIPRPPSPSVNRARGRIGFDSIETFSHGANTVTSTNLGVVFRGDITRIGGTYWNLSGYWRGRITRESEAAQNTLQETLNRTYHLNMTYDNPNSALVAGFGRLYLPWAPSLDTIDGGYFGVHLTKGTILGVFGGSTPDPSSWDYSPDRVISGGFVNFDGGGFDTWHYSSTIGGGISMVKWQVDRPFIFLEDSVSYRRTMALYESAQFDNPSGNTVTASPGPGLGRNFTTLRVNPIARVEIDANYNYFRDVPTFDTTLIGTGLLDKFLFQGFSAGGRVEVLPQIWISATLGRSNRSGDAKASLNQMYGITFGRIPIINLRADVHYSRFNSSFGDGHYEAVSLSRQVRDHLRFEALLGQQDFGSTLTTGNRSRFLTGTVETTLGSHYYLQGNFTTNRGDLSYDQIMVSMGYRFDNRRKRE
ncbi:MAG TPA: AMIN domain-containing protein [Candidatus Sulfotelmatobacter sp.]|nr:AMIN domain-containing protein [Candidatus Sulfotelmatobacter sp.]